MTGSGSEYASPPCFMHELDDGKPRPNGKMPLEVVRWRKAERERLIAARLEMTASERASLTQRILAGLNLAIGPVEGRSISLYWPFRGEPDLRPWMEEVDRLGGITALPVVVEKARPLVFRAWRKGDALERGVWNIPVPAADVPEIVPDVVIAPVVGFADNYRLGYGGGFFDRTLASLPRRPLVIGIGYSMQKIPTIYPQSHDIPMDTIITEKGIDQR